MSLNKETEADRLKQSYSAQYLRLSDRQSKYKSQKKLLSFTPSSGEYVRTKIFLTSLNVCNILRD